MSIPAPDQRCPSPRIVPSAPARSRKEDLARILTVREHEVLVLLARGLSNVAIAETLVVTVNTVEKHIKRVLSKLDIKPTRDTHRRVLAALTFHDR